MRSHGSIVGCVVGVSVLTLASGCVSLNAYRDLEAQRRSLEAGRQAMTQELYDARTANDTLRTQNGSMERELDTGNALIANLQRENELLEELRQTAERALEEMAGKQTLGKIAISGPKLPEPLHNALRQFADSHPSLVSYNAAAGTVKWKSDLLFALGSDIVVETSAASVRSFTDIIKSDVAANFEVIVVGHTDNVPIVREATKVKHPTNWHLSAHRAISVASILQTSGYGPKRIGVMGMGEYRPIVDNGSPTGAAQNRRVEIYIVPIGAIAHASATGVDWLNRVASSATQPGS